MTPQGTPVHRIRDPVHRLNIALSRARVKRLTEHQCSIVQWALGAIGLFFVILLVRGFWCTDAIAAGPSPYILVNLRKYLSIQIDKEADVPFPPGKPIVWNIYEPVGAWTEYCLVHLQLGRGDPHYVNAVIPYWIPLGVIGLGFWAVTTMKKTARRNVGLVCLKCGYDLRATPNRCPECGTQHAEIPSPRKQVNS